MLHGRPLKSMTKTTIRVASSEGVNDSKVPTINYEENKEGYQNKMEKA